MNPAMAGLSAYLAEILAGYRSAEQRDDLAASHHSITSSASCWR
jgi:hypothetical protein